MQFIFISSDRGADDHFSDSDECWLTNILIYYLCKCKTYIDLLSFAVSILSVLANRHQSGHYRYLRNLIKLSEFGEGCDWTRILRYTGNCTCNNNNKCFIAWQNLHLYGNRQWINNLLDTKNFHNHSCTSRSHLNIHLMAHTRSHAFEL